jgi:hypothetical protein
MGAREASLFGLSKSALQPWSCVSSRRIVMLKRGRVTALGGVKVLT